MAPAPASTSPQAGEMRFEISDEAAALIRGPRRPRLDLGGLLPAATRDNRPTRPTQPEWWKCTLDDLVVHVDSAIVQPEQWVLTTTDGALAARWEGRNPDLFGRLPVARRSPAAKAVRARARQMSS
jgi:hypothetical protein